MTSDRVMPGIMLSLLGLMIQIFAPLWFEKSELASFDSRMRFNLAAAGQEVTIVDIDQKTVDRFQRWPLPRRSYVQLIDNLNAAGAKVIVLDINFVTPDPQMDDELATMIRYSGNVVIGQYFFPVGSPNLPRALPNPGASTATYRVATDSAIKSFRGFRSSYRRGNTPQIESAGAQNTGHISIGLAEDDVPRRMPLMIAYRDQFYPPASVQAVRLYLGVPLDGMRVRVEGSQVTGIGIGDLSVPTDEDGYAWINYRGGARAFEHVSMVDAIDAAPTSLIHGHIVLVGAADPGMGDIFTTPFGHAPGVEVHAHMIDTMLHQAFISRSAWIDSLLILATAIGSFLLVDRVRPSRIIPLALVLLFCLWLGATILFATLRFWVAVALPEFLLILSCLWIVRRRLRALEPTEM